MNQVDFEVEIHKHDCPLCDAPLVCDLAFIDQDRNPVFNMEAVHSRNAHQAHPKGHEDKQAVLLSLYCQQCRILMRP